MTRQPRIPMRPSDLPQQRLYLVKGLPRRPANWSLRTGQAAAEVAPPAMPRSARYIGQVEWAWSSVHTRIDAYYLSMCRRHRHWVLWSRGYDSNWSRWMDPRAMAVALRAGLPLDAAARLMLHDAWALERVGGLDRFHWVNESGVLNAGELAEVAAAVWADATDESDVQRQADL